MFHRSQRLLLRPIWPEDTEALFAGIADEGVACNLARAPWPYEKRHAHEWAARLDAPFYPRFLITLAADAQVIGSIGIGPMADPAQEGGTPELGYWITRAHWGQGYATEAGAAVLSIARALGHSALVAAHFVDNPASGRVLRKLGFVPTGRPAKRFSAVRGHAVEAVEYARDLKADMDPAPFARAA